MTWHRVSSKSLCPICQKADWCTVSDSGLICCMRVESPRPSKNSMGGWLHESGYKPSKVFQVPERKPPIPQINASKLITEWASETPYDWLSDLAINLGVSDDSLASLNACYARQHRAWAFPMRDGYGNPVGIRLRSEDGRKWAVKGSRQGIFIPEIESQSPIYVCEGPTDTAAALTLGLYAVGRPSCVCGASDIKTLCKRLGVRNVVIVADNDEGKHRPDGSPWNPGIEGAHKIGIEIGLRHCIYVPPAKDIREFVRMGGTKTLIENTVKGMKWIH